jgi:hypothetical protein
VSRIWPTPLWKHDDAPGVTEGVQWKSRRMEPVCVSLFFLMFRPLPSSPMPRLVVNARNAHLGPRNGRNATSKSQKKSAQRREMMFENSAAPPADPFPPRRLPIIPSTAVPEKCHAKHAAILQWVRRYHSLSPSHLSIGLT